MPKKDKRKIVPSGGGVFHDLANQIKLILRLVSDPRISPLLKMLPIGSGLYFIIPDIFPGPIDDALVIGIATVLFIELCPPEIVQEHRDALANVVPGEWRDAKEQGSEFQEPEFNETDIVEGEFRDEE